MKLKILIIAIIAVIAAVAFAEYERGLNRAEVSPTPTISISPTSSPSPYPTTPNGQSGVRGKVTIGPTCPVQKIPPDPKCADKPYQTTLNVFKGDKFVTSFTSAADGTFYVSLPPGSYLITKTGDLTRSPTLAPVSVIISSSQIVEITIRFDSGIR